MRRCATGTVRATTAHQRFTALPDPKEAANKEAALVGLLPVARQAAPTQAAHRSSSHPTDPLLCSQIPELLHPPEEQLGHSGGKMVWLPSNPGA